MNEQEIGHENYDWIYVVHDRSLLVGSCENGTEPSGLTKMGEFLYQVGKHWFLNMDSAPWS